MKKISLIAFLLIFAALLSCCSPAPKFDDPEKQAAYENVAALLEEEDWEALGSSSDWYAMRSEDSIRRTAAKKLTGFMKADDLDSALELFTCMPFDFVDGGSYYTTNKFMTWVVNHFANGGTRYIKEAGQGGYYDTHASELVEFTNYDELTDTEYVSRCWYSGDFALNIYTSRNRTTGELTADHSVGLYVAGTCVSLVSDTTKNIDGATILKGYIINGSYYGMGNYILCNVGTSCLVSFILTDTTDGGYAIVRTQLEEFEGPQHKIG